ncbi:MAG: HAMP domain-containing protein [Chlorobi bacterium]|nr:HAMP domain-containing protein [Chlorobiota bacterium]
MRLSLMYGAVAAITTVAFAFIAYYTVMDELQNNLDASLLRAGNGLLAVVQREHTQQNRPLQPVKQRRRDSPDNVFEFLQRSSLREFVGPIPVTDDVFEQPPDPVWSAVYEHVLLNASSFLLQVRSAKGDIVWKSDNLLTDSLPSLRSLLPTGKGDSNRVWSWFEQDGIRYRIVVIGSSIAEVATAYPVGEIDLILVRLFKLVQWGFPVTIVVSMFIGWLLARRALKPVDRVVRSARRITAENLSERLPVPPANDEIGRLVETLNSMIARLQQSFEQVRQFTSDASHELKTPLAIMMGELEVALRNKNVGVEARAILTSCLEEVERLTHVVQGLLELSRAESGQVVIEKVPVDFSVMIADVADVIERLATRKQITLHVAIQPDLIVTGDALRLRQAVLNIVENAVKYTPAGGTVHITLLAEFNDVILRVSDTGIGIPESKLPFIFDRFYRVDQARSQDVSGTGLGLSIVRWIVDEHHGRIQVESTEGKGTTFSMVLPRTV